MVYKMNLWSLTLLPGEKYPIYVRRDFTITNAALGEDLRSNDGRSVVKVTHHPIPPSFPGDSDSEFDSEFDSDVDIDDSEEEFELDETEGFKLTPKKVKEDEDEDEEDEEEEEEEDDEEEDDEDDEDEDDSDLDDEFDDEIEETNVICALTAGRIEQATLDLTFVEGDAILLEVTGENAVHLLGNYIYQPGLNGSDIDSDSDSDSEFDDEHDDYSELYGSEFDEEIESDEEIPDATIEEIEVDLPVKEQKSKVQAKIEAAPEGKKRKADAIESPVTKSEPAEAETLSKAQKKKLAKKVKRESDAAAAPAAAPAAEKKPVEKKGAEKKRTLPSGLVIEDVKVGDGPVAKTGKRLGMRYIGKLENGKQFDANTGGKPFVFQLGRGEVIRGWDEGLAGMAVGGERRLTIPPALAYGNQKIPGIPKGSTLKFDVKLVSVN